MLKTSIEIFSDDVRGISCFLQPDNSILFGFTLCGEEYFTEFVGDLPLRYATDYQLLLLNSGLRLKHWAIEETLFAEAWPRYPNLDDADSTELETFIFKYQRGFNLDDIFPLGEENRARMVQFLVEYANNKLKERSARQADLLNAAGTFVFDNDMIYSRLPSWARSW